MSIIVNALCWLPFTMIIAFTDIPNSVKIIGIIIYVILTVISIFIFEIHNDRIEKLENELRKLQNSKKD